MPACKFTKKTLSHILFHVFYLHFLRMYHDYFFWRGSENVRAQFLLAEKYYLLNHDSSKSTIFMLNVAFDALLSAVFVKYSKLKSFVSCNIKLFAMYFVYLKLIILHHGHKNFDIWTKFTLSTIISTRKEW